VQMIILRSAASTLLYVAVQKTNTGCDTSSNATKDGHTTT
jgi:hypothetical protein